MTRFLLAGAAALGMMTGAAMAQSSTSSSSTTTTTTVPMAPVTTSSSATVGQAVHADGDRSATAGTSSADSAGNATSTTITNTTYPLTNMVETKEKTLSTTNGVTKELVTTTDVHPPATGRPEIPPVTTTTERLVK